MDINVLVLELYMGSRQRYMKFLLFCGVGLMKQDLPQNFDIDPLENFHIDPLVLPQLEPKNYTPASPDRNTAPNAAPEPSNNIKRPTRQVANQNSVAGLNLRDLSGESPSTEPIGETPLGSAWLEQVPTDDLIQMLQTRLQREGTAYQENKPPAYETRFGLVDPLLDFGNERYYWQPISPFDGPNSLSRFSLSWLNLWIDEDSELTEARN
ncbi:hypothetical protein BT96DRAFT_1057017 [Gymnopus androsaceus JB14]|uniref:Uncharacterized protein n=1 Tax=Gymnopus androsaceus JB14 TaxID=1447944 RepID=A0A6A4H466_9AGAR|nr:hypothetical protein BT96DRAFT_1057017 [Gymnopus androsaceus JB14]